MSDISREDLESIMDAECIFEPYLNTFEFASLEDYLANVRQRKRCKHEICLRLSKLLEENINLRHLVGCSTADPVEFYSKGTFEQCEKMTAINNEIQQLYREFYIH
jgi:hypothetical protein